MKIAVLHAEYDSDTAQINLLCSSISKKIALKFPNFQPYFYIVPEKADSFLKELRNIPNVQGFEVQGEKIKIYAKHPRILPELRENVKRFGRTYEYDIPIVKKFLMDKNLTPLVFYEARISDNYVTEFLEEFEDMNQYRTLAFDFETYQNRIVLAAFYSEKIKKIISAENFHSKSFKNTVEVEVIEDEKNRLKKILELLNSEDFDFVVGYNSDGFDLQFLKTICEKLGVEHNIVVSRRGIREVANIGNSVHIDLFQFVSNILSKSIKIETLTLNNVARIFLNEGKEEFEFEKLNEMWNRKDPNLLEYCLKDAELVFKLSKELLPLIVEMSKISGVLPFDLCRSSYGQLVENLLMREAVKKNFIIPNRPKQSEIQKRLEESYEGGFVKEPKEGFYEKVAVFDFRSLYPSIILAHNISPETINCACCKKNSQETYFCTKKQGFIPEVIKRLVEQRFRLKDQLKELERGSAEYLKIDAKQKALKIFLNAFYGYLAYAGARWYSKECAEAITSLGRKYIKQVMTEAENAGFNVIYGDTDSIILVYTSKEKALKFLEKINQELPKSMELELEGFYKTGIFTFTKEGRGAKKRYALLREDGELKIVGFEKVRRDWSTIAKEVQHSVISEVLHKNISKAVDLVRKTIQDLKEKKVPIEKLSIHTQITKSLRKYDVQSPHTEAARKAIERGVKISSGDVIKYIITPGKGSISERAELFKFAQDYDPDYYISHQIIPAALRILKVFGYREEDLMAKTKQSPLKKFF